VAEGLSYVGRSVGFLSVVVPCATAGEGSRADLGSGAAGRPSRVGLLSAPSKRCPPIRTDLASGMTWKDTSETAPRGLWRPPTWLERHGLVRRSVNYRSSIGRVLLPPARHLPTAAAPEQSREPEEANPTRGGAAYGSQVAT